MPKITYADEVYPRFGIPWPTVTHHDEQGPYDIQCLNYNRGEPKFALEGPELEWLKDEHPDVYARCEQLIEKQPKAEAYDPISYGWILPQWERFFDLWAEKEQDADGNPVLDQNGNPIAKWASFVIFGGQRSTKSTLLSRVVNWFALNVGEAQITCWQVDKDKSVADQQSVVAQNLPRRYRIIDRETGELIRDQPVMTLNDKRDSRFNFGYKEQSGFAGHKILFVPNPGYRLSSKIFFNWYGQYLLNPQKAESYARHINWLDEEAPLNLFKTLQSRAGGDFHGKTILTFTTLQGWTPLVTDLLQNVTTDRSVFQEEIGRELPLEQTSHNWDRCKILYFPSKNNPFFDYREHRRKWRMKPISEQLAVLFGIPTRTYTTAFPKFDKHIHTIPHSELPWISGEARKEDYTFYCLLDPHGDRRWFILWAAVDSAGVVYIYREWPDESEGEWALPHQDRHGKPVGKPGDGAKGKGETIGDYVELIRDLEKGEKIFERYIDPRMGHHPTHRQLTSGEYERTHICDMLADEQLDFIPAPGVKIDDDGTGVQKINDLLGYDEAQPISPTNFPKLIFSRNCVNTIYCMEEYTGKAGRSEATKDPPDCIRYGVEAGLEHVPGGGTIEVTGVVAY